MRPLIHAAFVPCAVVSTNFSVKTTKHTYVTASRLISTVHLEGDLGAECKQRFGNEELEEFCMETVFYSNVHF